MSKLRYYAANEKKTPVAVLPKAVHTEFLRTGRISRKNEDWLADERRYLTYEEVAERTGRRLTAAGETTHQRINSFHRSIRFPKLVFHQTLENSPHLGYCHVTAARANFAKFADVKWAFYIANFSAEIGEGEHFFEEIRPYYSRMYFAVAMQPDAKTKAMSIDRSIRPDGLLFRTHDPKQALKNILKLGTSSKELRQIIDKL